MASNLSSNPFLDPYQPLRGAVITYVGQPLSRIEVPPIQTLVHKTEDTPQSLSVVDVSQVLNRAGITPRESVLIRDELIGIELDINVFGTAPSSGMSGSVSPADMQMGQTVGRNIPTNMKEARDSLEFITAQRTGGNHKNFGINDLKKIAKNLHLPTTGNKDVLVNRIRTAVIDYYNLDIQ